MISPLKNNIRYKKPWPTKDAMDQIYEKHLWGGKDFDFYSGEGSHLPKFVEPYLIKVGDFLRSFEQPPVVCDLGCGDFNVGKELVPFTKKYVAVDIVENLVLRNRTKFRDERLEFRCLNIATDELPAGDCAILRQVLQHLSNAEIQCIVPKLENYKYLIVTEHLPDGRFKPNLNIISGQGTRLKKQSGVDLTAPPFDMKVQETQQLLSVRSITFGGHVVTTLYKMN